MRSVVVGEARRTLRAAVMLSTIAISWKRPERKTDSHKTRLGLFFRIVSCMATMAPSTRWVPTK